MQHPRRLVTQEEVVEAVWGKVAMSDSLLRTHIRELRLALGEGIIETVIGRGYRFVADVKEIDESSAPASDAAAAAAAPRRITGRIAELDALCASFQQVSARQRRVVLVTGDAGVGKTTLVDALIDHAVSAGARAARGASVEQFGSGEAYLPVLDAVTSLCRGRGGERVVDVLGRHAPTWLAQMPGVVHAGQFEELLRRAADTSQARMLRELAEALEVLSTERPVVLVLDDLQWADHSTAELLAHLARRREPARLMIVGAYRPAELARTNPLTRLVGELVVHKQATAIPLDAFTLASVDEYIATRFAEHRFPRELVSTLHTLTGGNPLFVATLVDDLESRALIGEKDGTWQLLTSIEDVAARRPESIRRLIDIQIDRLGADQQRILEVASVAGITFTAGVVAHALDQSVDDVDSSCELLASDHRFLQYVGAETWRDGTIQSRYGFAHALFRHAALARSPAASVRLFHRRIGERLETGYLEDVEAVAGELAGHFDAGQAFVKAAHYYSRAGERARKRNGLFEALAHFERARQLLAQLPEGTDKDLLELRVLDGLGPCHVAVRPSDIPEIVSTFVRASELAKRLGDDRRLYAALFGLQRCRMLQGELRAIAEHAGEVMQVTKRLPNPAVGKSATYVMATAALFRGRFEEAQEGFAIASTLNALDEPMAPNAGLTAVLAWLTGHPDRALEIGRAELSAAETDGDPFLVVLALCNVGAVQAWRRELLPACATAKRAIDFAVDARIGFWLARARLLAAWAEAELDPASATKHVDALLAQPFELGGIRRTLDTTWFVELLARAGRRDRALEEIAGALAHADRTDERVGEPELLRLQGELVRATDKVEAERCFETALALAQKQSSTSFALRAATSLCGVRSGAKRRQALADLRRILATFTEGSATGDLAAARAVLGE